MRTLFILLLFAGTLQAQQIAFETDTIQWEVDQLNDTNADSRENFTCVFVTDKAGNIRWIQENGNFVNEFEVQSSEGNWRDLNSDGYKEFMITYLGKNGKIRFSRTDGVMQIHMIFREGERNTTPYVFRVKSFTKL